MKTALKIFEECASVVDQAYMDADGSERLRAAIALTDLTLRQEDGAMNHKRWEESRPQHVEK